MIAPTLGRSGARPRLLARWGRYTPTALGLRPPTGRPSVLAWHGLGEVVAC
jgi:hypothetical protein